MANSSVCICQMWSGLVNFVVYRQEIGTQKFMGGMCKKERLQNDCCISSHDIR